MKERPIIFSAPMVRAILDGPKTMTRRRVKRVIQTEHGDCITDLDGGPSRLDLAPRNWELCPYGVPGDRLWVRETWASVCRLDATPAGNPYDPWLVYRATDDLPDWPNPDGDPWRWSASLFMPRWASRITLEVTDVRAERVQEISERDCKAEGVREYLYEATGDHPHMIGYVTDADGPDEHGTAAHQLPQHAFANLWESIHGPGAWERNDWVWCIGFKRITP